MLQEDAVFAPSAPFDVGSLVVTRYNLRLFQDRLSEADYAAWLSRRTDHFLEVCLPSLLAQRRRPDRWVIAFDGLQRDRVAHVVEAIAEHDWIEPVWQEADESWPDLIDRAVAPYARQFDVLTVTRCDNDDALALVYLRVAERYARAALEGRRGPIDFWLAFPVGAQLHEGRFYQYIQTRPHFLTRVTRGTSPGPGGSVYAINHSNLWRDPAREVHAPVTKKPVWLENVHGTNLVNRAQGQPFELQPTAGVAASFGIPPVPPGA